MARRSLKRLRQRIYGGRGAVPVLLTGCQRSGTNMLLSVLDNAPDTWVENEAWDSAAFLDYRLRLWPDLESLLANSAASAMVFKPLCDAQILDELLAARPDALAIWLYRDYKDVAGSAVRVWGDHQREVVEQIVQGKTEGLDWRAERVGAETLAGLCEVWSPAVSSFEGALLFWYLRNRIYFELGLQGRTDVMLVRYEDIVTRPHAVLPRVFRFVGCRYSPGVASDIFTSTVGESKAVEVRPEIEDLCEALLSQLNRAAAVPEAAGSGAGRA